LAPDWGAVLLTSGAEIRQVEEAVYRVFTAHGHRAADRPRAWVLVGGFPMVPGLTSFQALGGQKGVEALAATVAAVLGVLAVTGVARLSRIPEEKTKVNMD